MLPAFCDSHSIHAKRDVLYVYSNRNVSAAQYFGANIVLLSISTALTVLVLNIHHRGSRGNPVPAMVQMVVLDWLARILGMGKCVHGKNKINSDNAKMVGVNTNERALLYPIRGTLLGWLSISRRLLLWYCLFHLTTRKAAMLQFIMSSSNGNIFRVTGPLCGEFTGRRRIPRSKASDAELWCFLWSAHWVNGWVNNHEAGDLRRHRAHYDANVMP